LFRLACRALAAAVLCGGLAVPDAGAVSSRFVKVFPLPAGESMMAFPHQLIVGPDGAMWFGAGAGMIGRMDLQGHFSQLSLGPGDGGANPVQNLALAPDGSMWFDTYDEASGVPAQMGRMTRDGGVSWYPMSDNDQQGRPTQVEPDGAPAVDRQGGVWVLNSNSVQFQASAGTCAADGEFSYLNRLGDGGQTASYPFCGWSEAPPLLDVLGIGPDGSPWYASGNSRGDFISRLRDDGSSVAYPIADDVIPAVIATGPGNALWYLGIAHGGNGQDAVVRFEPDGTSTVYLIPGFGPGGITEGRDGAIWIADNSNGTVTPGKNPPTVWRLDPGGGLMRYSFSQFVWGLTGYDEGVWSIVAGPDGGLWFGAQAPGGDAIVRLDPSAVPDQCLAATTMDATTTGKLVPRPVIPPPVVITPSMKYAAQFASQLANAADRWQWAVKLGLLVVPGTEEVDLVDLVDGTDVISASVENLLERIAEDSGPKLQAPHVPACSARRAAQPWRVDNRVAGGCHESVGRCRGCADRRWQCSP
jgi:streptogramin lyase